MAGNNTLDDYRKRASFDIGKLKQLIEPKEIIELRDSVWETLAKDALFADPGEVSCDEHQKIVIKRNKRLLEYNFVTDTPEKRYAYLTALFAHDVSNLSPHAVSMHAASHIQISFVVASSPVACTIQKDVRGCPEKGEHTTL